MRIKTTILLSIAAFLLFAPLALAQTGTIEVTPEGIATVLVGAVAPWIIGFVRRITGSTDITSKGGFFLAVAFAAGLAIVSKLAFLVITNQPIGFDADFIKSFFYDGLTIYALSQFIFQLFKDSNQGENLLRGV